MEAFWCITLGFLILRAFWKGSTFRHKPKLQPVDPALTHVTPVEGEKVDDEAARKQAAREAKDIAELKKQGYTDELIAVILPTLYNDGQ